MMQQLTRKDIEHVVGGCDTTAHTFCFFTVLAGIGYAIGSSLHDWFAYERACGPKEMGNAEERVGIIVKDVSAGVAIASIGVLLTLIVGSAEYQPLRRPLLGNE